MSTDMIALELAYKAAIRENKIPLVFEHDGSYYNMSPIAVKDLQFSLNGLNFLASFNGRVQKIALFKDDIAYLVTQDELGDPTDV